MGLRSKRKSKKLFCRTAVTDQRLHYNYYEIFAKQPEFFFFFFNLLQQPKAWTTSVATRAKRCVNRPSRISEGQACPVATRLKEAEKALLSDAHGVTAYHGAYEVA